MPTDIKHIVDQVLDLSRPSQEAFSLSALQEIPIEATAGALKKFLAEKPEEEKKEIIQHLTAAIGSAPPIGGPSQGIRDHLWLIVVVAFALVLIGSFVTLALGVFWTAQGKVTPELILTMFTSVVGFLAGLFVPSPVGNRGQSNSG